MATEPRLAPGIGLTTALPLGALWKTEMDANMIKASALIQLRVLDRVAAVPGSPTGGDMYILTAAPHDKAVALYDDDHWEYIVPAEGWKAYVVDEAVDYQFDGADWVVYNPSAGALDPDLAAIAALTPSNDDIIQRKAGAWTNRTMAQLATDLGLAATYQPLDSDLTAFAGLTPTNDDIIQRKAGAWTNRTMAQLATDLALAVTYQPLDSDLTAIAAIAPSNDDIIQRKAGAWTNRTMAQLATDLQTALGAVYQPLDSDLTAIAALTPTNDDIIQRKAGAWTNRTMAQLKTDLDTALSATYVAKAGGTMTGRLAVPAGDLSVGGILVGTTAQIAQAVNGTGAATTSIALAGLVLGDIHRYAVSSQTPGFEVNDTSSGASGAFIRWNATGSSASAIYIGHSKGTTVGDFTTLASGDILGSYSFVGADGTSLIQGARMRVIVSGTVATGILPSRLTLETADAAGTVTERMGIEVDGSFTMGGSATAWFDLNRVWHPREYTVGTAPATSGTGVIQLSDEGGGKALAIYDSIVSAYRRIDDGQVISATAGARGLLARMPTRADYKLREAIRSTYQKLEDAGLTSKLLGLWVHAMPTSAMALMNWITPGTRDLAIAGTPTFAANIGFTGNGTDAQLQTNASLTTFGQVTIDDMAIGTYVRTADSTGLSNNVIGFTSAAFSGRLQLESDTSGTILGRPNQGASTAYAVTKYTGAFHIQRTGTNATELFIDGVSQSTGATVSVSNSGFPGFLASVDSGGSKFSNAQISYSFISLSMTATQVRQFYSIMYDFLVKRGAITVTVANLPPAEDFSGLDLFVPDLGGGAGMLTSDGTKWKRQSEFQGYEAISADANTTVYPLSNAAVIELTGTRTANRDLTLGHGAGGVNRYYTGARKRVIVSGTGNFDWVIKDNAGTTLIKLRARQSANFLHNGTNWVLDKEIEAIQVVLSDSSTALSTGTNKAFYVWPYNFKVVDGFLALAVAQSSSGVVTVDINNSAGTTIMTTKPSIDASESTSDTGTAPVFATSDFVRGDITLFDIDAAGTGAKGLIFTFLGYR
jgi:hypothetical protein